MANRIVARCKRCPQTPPWGFCPDCEAINRHRQQVGLLIGVDDPRASLNNTMYPVVQGKYRGSRRFERPGRARPVITACIERKGGWRRGVAKLNGKVVYESEPKRGKACVSELMAWANARAEQIRIGLEYEG